MTTWLVVIAVTAALLYWQPWIVFAGLALFSLKWHAHVGSAPLGPLLVAAAFVLFSLWRWPFAPCPSCGPAKRRNGTNIGSTRFAWGRCRHNCKGGEVWQPGARWVARITRSRYHSPS